MKRSFLLCTVALSLAFAWGCNSLVEKKPSEVSDRKTRTLPLSISFVPAWSGPSGRGISMATNTLDTFYVIVTNVSDDVQTAFRTSNSWGYYAVSFELQTVDGRTFAISKKPQAFTKNTPTTFVIPPREQMVFPIKLDAEWDAVPPLPIADETPLAVTLKAIYEVKPTPESAQQKVWSGRVESRAYHFNFRHWLARADAD
jgi:hypothetical protein